MPLRHGLFAFVRIRFDIANFWRFALSLSRPSLLLGTKMCPLKRAFEPVHCGYSGKTLCLANCANSM
jgi:hypothetical protein